MRHRQSSVTTDTQYPVTSIGASERGDCGGCGGEPRPRCAAALEPTSVSVRSTPPTETPASLTNVNIAPAFMMLFLRWRLGLARGRVPLRPIGFALEVRARVKRLLQILRIVDCSGDDQPRIAIRVRGKPLKVFRDGGGFAVWHSIFPEIALAEIRCRHPDDSTVECARSRRWPAAQPGSPTAWHVAKTRSRATTG